MIFFLENLSQAPVQVATSAAPHIPLRGMLVAVAPKNGYL